MSNERIDLTQFEELIKSIVICEEEYIKGQDSLLEDCQALKDRMQIILSELKRCYEREDMIIGVLKGVWIGTPCWHQPSEHLESIAETRGSILGGIASFLDVDVNRQDIHDLEYGCRGENCDHNASE
jgi:hypothetical protein